MVLLIAVYGFNCFVDVMDYKIESYSSEASWYNLDQYRVDINPDLTGVNIALGFENVPVLDERIATIKAYYIEK